MKDHLTITKLSLLTSLCLLFSCHLSVKAQPEGPENFRYIYSKELNPKYNDFNFWNGHWDVVWKTWSGNDSYTPVNWSEHRVYSALDGKALIEMAYGDSVVQGSRTVGFSIRYFDFNLNKWVMFQSWPGKNMPNFSSLQGTHHHKRIQLYKKGQTTRPRPGVPVGSPYLNRYTFSDAHQESFRWESSYSLDSTRTWHTMTVAEGIRKDDFPSLVDSEGYWFTYAESCNCDDKILEPIKPYLGKWSGEIRYKEGKNNTKYSVFRLLQPFLGGCAAWGYQLTFTGDRVKKEIIFASPLMNGQGWVFYALNDQMGESHKTFFTKEISSKTTFTKKDTFDVVSSGQLKSFSWALSKSGKQVISGGSPDDSWSFEMALKRMEE